MEQSSNMKEGSKTGRAEGRQEARKAGKGGRRRRKPQEEEQDEEQGEEDEAALMVWRLGLAWRVLTRLVWPLLAWLGLFGWAGWLGMARTVDPAQVFRLSIHSKPVTITTCHCPFVNCQPCFFSCQLTITG